MYEKTNTLHIVFITELNLPINNLSLALARGSLGYSLFCGYVSSKYSAITRLSYNISPPSNSIHGTLPKGLFSNSQSGL